MSIPKELKYVDSHEWIREEGAEAVIGITHFAQEQLGDVTFVDLPKVGAHLGAGQEMGSIESVKAASELYCPVAGEVTAVNAALEQSPELVNTSPYNEGWMIRVKFSAPLSGLLSADEYQKTIQG